MNRRLSKRQAVFEKETIFEKLIYLKFLKFIFGPAQKN